MYAPPLLTLILCVSSAHAAPSDLRNARRAAKQAVQSLSATKRFASKLEGAQAERFRQAATRMGLPDQDGDLVPDILEQLDGTDACKASSDGEHHDGSLRKREGEIADITDFSITVDDVDFILNNSTVYLGLTQDDLDLEVCVEVRGFENNDGDIIATRVSASDSCYGGFPGRGYDQGPGENRGGRRGGGGQ